MKKILLLLFLFSRIIDSSFSQDLYLKTGVNSTNYKFVDDKGQPIYKFLPAIAPSFEIGMVKVESPIPVINAYDNQNKTIITYGE